MKIYKSEAAAGYGARLYVPYEQITVDIQAAFNVLSSWGGHDKDTGKCKAWEFPNREPYRLVQAENFARGLGFTVELVSTNNHHEVWS